MADITLWIYFNLFLFFMLALDLGVFHKKDQKVSIKQSLLWSLVWIVLALIFNYGIYVFQGSDKALDFLTGYVIEKSLSIDNVFVILLIFQYFAIPEHLQHRVLFWGVLGALVMRFAFIFLGVELIAQLHWVIYIFGAFLLFTGIKMVVRKEQETDFGNSFLIQIMKRIIPVSSTLDSNKFFTRINGKLLATPLFFCLIVIEFSDLIFAIDSIPAILAITTDEFIVYSSNAFAILGLRSLYFSLSRLVKIFGYLQYALAFILCFVGVKMLIVDYYHIPTFVSLAIILLTLGISVILSLLFKNDSIDVKNEQI